MAGMNEGRSGEALCDICGVGRAPFLRYGTVERMGRMCRECLHRTRICARCQRPATEPVPVGVAHGATGPGWTEYACLACTDQKTTYQEARRQSPVSVIGRESHPAPPTTDNTGLRLEGGAT